MVSLTSISFTSANVAWAMPDVLKVVRTRTAFLKLARVRSSAVKLQSVRFARSKLASRTSLALNELPVKSAPVKLEPRNALPSNFPLCAVTPAKSLFGRLLPLKFISTCRSSERERLATSCTVCSMSPMLSTVISNAVASSLPSALSSRNRSCKSESRSALSSSALFTPL